MTEDSSNTNPNLPLIVVVLNFYDVVRKENIWCALRVKHLWHRVDGRDYHWVHAYKRRLIASLIPVKMTGI